LSSESSSLEKIKRAEVRLSTLISGNENQVALYIALIYPTVIMFSSRMESEEEVEVLIERGMVKD
jgi:hypothetical protein